MPITRAITLGGLTVGILDGLDAVIFFGLRGVAPIRIFQAIASGLLGPASFKGGLQTAALGVVLHFAIAFSIVAVLVLASRRMPFLTRNTVLIGIVYGLIVYAVMNGVVLPLSAVKHNVPSGAVLINGLVIHMLGVGLPAALAARWSAQSPLA